MGSEWSIIFSIIQRLSDPHAGGSDHHISEMLIGER